MRKGFKTLMKQTDIGLPPCALIACASQKQAHEAKARDLYTSTLFRLNLEYAVARGAEPIYILSAKYGLLALDTVVAPYDVTLNTMPAQAVKAWAVRVRGQLETQCDVAQTHFIILAGQKYRKYLTPYLSSYEVPMAGLAIGQQLQFLKRQLAAMGQT